MSNCGVKAHVKFKVSPELVGKLGTVTIDRLGRNTTITVTDAWKIDRTQMNFEWPDLQKPNGTDYYGGCKADWKGLSKEDYKTKFTAQEFEVNLKVGPSGKKSSKKVKIDPYPDVAPVHRQVGLAMDINIGAAPLALNAAGQVIPVVPLSQANQAMWVTRNCGDFWLEYKEGLIVITVKVDMSASRPGPVEDRVFNHFKQSAERLWNGPNGFRQWVFHSKKCVRKSQCDCAVLFNGESSSQEKLIFGGCCKFPVRVNVEKGADNPIFMDFLSGADIQATRVTNLATGSAHQAPVPRFDTGYVCYPEDVPNSYAHEVGHMMGFPDEYPRTANGTEAANLSLFPIDPDSIMGTDMNCAKKRHFDWGELAKNWVNSDVTAVTSMPRNP